MKEFHLNSEYIELIKLLKHMGFAETGGHAKILVEEGEVLRNGEVEYRKRAKLVTGDKIEVLGETVKII